MNEKKVLGNNSRISEQLQKDRLTLRDRAEKNDIIVIDRSLLGQKEKI